METAALARATASLFYMPVRDEILYVVTDEASFTGLNVNVPATLRRGAEFTLRGRYGSRLDGFVNYTVTKATFETDLVRFGAGRSPARPQGRRVSAGARHRLGFGMNFRPAEGWTLTLAGTYVGRQFMLNDEANEFSRLDDYFVLNGRVAYTWGRWTAFLTVSNVTNAEYDTYGVVASDSGKPAAFLAPAPATTALAGLSFRFDCPTRQGRDPGGSASGWPGGAHSASSGTMRRSLARTSPRPVMRSSGRVTKVKEAKGVEGLREGAAALSQGPLHGGEPFAHVAPGFQGKEAADGERDLLEDLPLVHQGDAAAGFQQQVGAVGHVVVAGAGHQQRVLVEVHGGSGGADVRAQAPDEAEGRAETLLAVEHGDLEEVVLHVRGNHPAGAGHLDDPVRG